MEENKMTNIFEQSLLKNELKSFILGNNGYLVIDRDGDGHWPLGSYKQYVEPIVRDSYFSELFWFKLDETLDSVNDINLFIDNLVGYFIPYYNCSDEDLKKIRVKKTPINVISKIKSLLILNKDNLLKDYRGTGVEWNSKSGLWGGITSNLRIIEKRGGPNFLPCEE
jgi:hypothetical protein